MLHGPEQPGRMVAEMLRLAGVFISAIAAHGPSVSLAAAQLGPWQNEYPEQKETEIETLMHDLHDIMEFIAELTQPAYDSDYDEKYEPLVRCGVQAVDTHIEAPVVRVEGFKNPMDRAEVKRIPVFPIEVREGLSEGDGGSVLRLYLTELYRLIQRLMDAAVAARDRELKVLLAALEYGAR